MTGRGGERGGGGQHAANTGQGWNKSPSCCQGLCTDTCSTKWAVGFPSFTFLNVRKVCLFKFELQICNHWELLYRMSVFTVTKPFSFTQRDLIAYFTWSETVKVKTVTISSPHFTALAEVEVFCVEPVLYWSILSITGCASVNTVWEDRKGITWK